MPAAVRLLDLGYFPDRQRRVRADENGSFGLTTLERRHVRRRQTTWSSPSSASGVEHHIEIDDVTVIEAIDVTAAGGGQDLRLLAYKEGRSWRSILPDLVNEYVRSSTGLEATAKGLPHVAPPCFGPWRSPRARSRGDQDVARGRSQGR